jgi:amino acid permease
MTDSLSCFMAGIMNIIARMIDDLWSIFDKGRDLFLKFLCLVYCFLLIWLFYMTSVKIRDRRLTQRTRLIPNGREKVHP